MKGSTHQEDKIILNLHAPNNIISKYNKKNGIALKEKFKNSQS